MLHTVTTLPRQIVSEAVNAICNKARDRMADESRHLATLYGIQDAASRFHHGCCGQDSLLELLECSTPTVREGDGSGTILGDAIVAIYALVEVSQ